MTELEKQLRDALVPFATALIRKREKALRKSRVRAVWFDEMPDRYPIEIIFTMGDLRRAEKALQEISKSEQ